MLDVDFLSLESPADRVRERFMRLAEGAVSKLATDLTEDEKVALVYVAGGPLALSMKGAACTFTTVNLCGFYNRQDGKIVVVIGPTPS